MKTHLQSAEQLVLLAARCFLSGRGKAAHEEHAFFGVMKEHEAYA